MTDGRLCPTVEHACRTVEGAAVWDGVRRSGGWSGGGFSPRRIDRAALHARLADTPAWILEDLVDAFEPAALEAIATAKKKRTPGRPSREAETEPEEGSEP